MPQLPLLQLWQLFGLQLGLSWLTPTIMADFDIKQLLLQRESHLKVRLQLQLVELQLELIVFILLWRSVSHRITLATAGRELLWYTEPIKSKAEQRL